MDWMNLLLSRKGRISRKTYLWGLVPIAVLIGLLYVYLKFIATIMPAWADIVIAGLIGIEGIYFMSNLSVKRMHDYGRSAPYLVLLFAPLILAAFFMYQQKFMPTNSHEASATIYILLLMLAMISFLWMLSELLFRRSDEEVNNFGKPPDNEKGDTQHG